MREEIKLICDNWEHFNKSDIAHAFRMGEISIYPNFYGAGMKVFVGSSELDLEKGEEGELNLAIDKLEQKHQKELLAKIGEKLNRQT